MTSTRKGLTLVSALAVVCLAADLACDQRSHGQRLPPLPTPKSEVAPHKAAAKRSPLPTDNYGLDLGSLEEDDQRPPYSMNGKEVSRTEVIEALEQAPNIPDSRDKLQVLVIGAEPDCKRAEGMLAAWKDRVLVRSYRPEHWHVKEYKATGKPTVCVVTPSGDVLHRQDDVSDDPTGLVTAVGACQADFDRLRRPRPDQPYDPSKTPDRRRVIPSILPKLLPLFLQNVPLAPVLIGGACVVAALLGRRKKQS